MAYAECFINRCVLVKKKSFCVYFYVMETNVVSHVYKLLQAADQVIFMMICKQELVLEKVPLVWSENAKKLQQDEYCSSYLPQLELFLALS